MAKMTRHEIREAAFILLFEMQLSGDNLDETIDTTVEAFELTMETPVKKLANGVTEHIDELDAIIAKYSTTRSVARISKVNLTIMRIALFEMIYSDDVPDKVAMNEAMELSKKYSDKQDGSFINGVLDSYYRSIGKKDE